MCDDYDSDTYEYGYSAGYNAGYDAGRDSLDWYIEDLQEDLTKADAEIERLENELRLLQQPSS